jgi:dihydrofolate reductase
MGRKTHESIGRVLPGRRNIIVTRRPDYTVEGCDIVHSVEDAIELAKKESPEKICVIGGGDIYTLALPLANEIDLTRVHATIEHGTAFFPEFSEEEWKLVSETEHPIDERHVHPFTFQIFRRRS